MVAVERGALALYSAGKCTETSPFVSTFSRYMRASCGYLTFSNGLSVLFSPVLYRPSSICRRVYMSPKKEHEKHIGLFTSCLRRFLVEGIAPNQRASQFWARRRSSCFCVSRTADICCATDIGSRIKRQRARMAKNKKKWIVRLPVRIVLNERRSAKLALGII